MATILLAHLQDLVSEARDNPDFDLLSELELFVNAVDADISDAEQQ